MRCACARLHAGPDQAHTVMVLNRDGMPGGLTQAQVEDALEMKVDVVIPDMPRRLANAANMGEPAVTGRGFFRVRVEEIARLVAFNRLLDSNAAAAGASKRRAEKRPVWRRLFGKA